MPKKSLEELLVASKTTAEFKQAATALEAGREQSLIGFPPSNPPVKVRRLLCKLLEERPDLAVEKMEVEARSGCSDFVGQVTVWPGPLTVDFEWCCKWRAEEQQWTDAMGLPDQIRAAREFDYQCFRKFDIGS
jgi:hypothetical protein